MLASRFFFGLFVLFWFFWQIFFFFALCIFFPFLVRKNQWELDSKRMLFGFSRKRRATPSEDDAAARRSRLQVTVMEVVSIYDSFVFSEKNVNLFFFSSSKGKECNAKGITTRTLSKRCLLLYQFSSPTI